MPSSRRRGENIQLPQHYSLWWVSKGDQWIPSKGTDNTKSVSLSWRRYEMYEDNCYKVFQLEVIVIQEIGNTCSTNNNTKSYWSSTDEIDYISKTLASHKVVPMPAKQPRQIWANISYEYIELSYRNRHHTNKPPCKFYGINCMAFVM